MVTGGKNLLPVGLLLGSTGVKGSVPQVGLGLCLEFAANYGERFPFRIASDKLFFLREFASCDVAESVIFNLRVLCTCP